MDASQSEEDDEKAPILHDYKHDTSSPHYGNTNLLYFVFIAFVSLGGFLFGYDTGVISGAMIPLKRVFNLSIELQELIVTMAIVGAIIGALASGLLNEKFGRRSVLLIGSALFTVGSVILGAANGVVMLLVGRVIVGLGIGLASMTVPVYIAETSPPMVRGKLITVYQLSITAGQFIASVLNGAFSYIHSDGWRYMLGVSAIPSIVMLIGCYFSPESPRWLVQKGHEDKARIVLRSIRDKDDVNLEFEDIQRAADSQTNESPLRTLTKILRTARTRRALVLGCGLQLFQQLSAINTVMYYSASIIQSAGVQDEKAIIWLAAAVAFGNFFFTLISFFLIEKVGRRKLTLASVLGVVVALCLLAATFYMLDHNSLHVTHDVPSNITTGCGQFTDCTSCVMSSNCGFCYVDTGGEFMNGSCLANGPHDTQPLFCYSEPYMHSTSVTVEWSNEICPSSYASLAVFAMIFYLAMFEIGLGPMPWIINAEIYPLWARNAGTSASTATNWTLNMLVSLTFLSLINYLTRTGVFALYAGVTFLGLIFLYFLLPETKGKKLEDIEHLFE